MSVKEDIIEKAILIRDLKSAGKRYKKIKKDDNTEKGNFKKIGRKYRLLLTFLFFFSLILIFMILPVIIATLTQGLWG